MRILCERCQTTFVVEDELIPSGGASVQCSRCQHVFMAPSPTDSPNSRGRGEAQQQRTRRVFFGSTQPGPPPGAPPKPMFAPPVKPTMTDSLFEQVFARPDDDAPRVVLADHLCELGDPRGEFISIQLTEPNGATGLAKGRAKQLKRHYEAWLPPGVQRSTAVFRRGFLHACRWMAPTLATHREWRLVERLECGNVNGVAGFPRDTLFSGTVLPRLKELGGADPSVFATLCESGLRSRVEILRTFYLPFEHLAGRIRAVAQFPALQTLDLEGTELPADGLSIVLRHLGALKRVQVDDLGSRLPLRGVREALPRGLTLSISVDRDRLCWFEFFGDEVRLCHRRSSSAYLRGHLIDRARREGLSASPVAVDDLP